MEDLQVSIDESVNDVHSFLEVELEALKSIYINELNVKTDLKYTDISIDLYPATADNLDQQYVRMTLQFLLDEGYPDDIPEILIRNPRGLSEEKQNSIMKDLLRIAEDKRGNSMLFEIIEAAKEHLTVGNRPCGECAICLCGFSENDVFTKTECYHHFHSHCLARYSRNFVESSQDYETDPKSKAISNELLCPMCRVPIEFNSHEDYPPPEGSGDNRFVLTEDVKELQGKMAKLFQEQVEKGGIIDIEAEKNKYLLEISNVPTRAAAEDKKLDGQLKSQDDTDDIDVDSASQQTNGVDSPIKQKKTYRDPNTLQDHRSRNQPYHRYDSRGNNRYNGRYNRPSYNDSRGNYNQHKYHRYPNQKYNNYERYERYSNNAKENNDHFEKASNYDKEPPESCFDSVSDNIDEHTETYNKSRYNPDRRYNRGYNRYSNSYNSRYDGAKRSDKTSQHDVCDGSRPEGQDDQERYSNNSAKKFNYKSDDYRRNSRYSGDRQRSETFTSDEQDSKTSNIPNSEDLISSSDDVAQKEKSRPYYSPRKPSYRSDYRDKPKYDGDRSNKSHYAKVQHSKAINEQDVEDDDEIVTDYHHQKDKRTTDYDSRKSNYRQNFDYNSSDRYSDRNSQRGGRRGFGRRGNYSGDSNFSGRNSYRDSERDQSYSERNRSFRGKESSRGNQYRGNESQDGYRHKNFRNFDRNSYAKHTNKPDAQLSQDNDRKSADFSSRSQSSDSNQLSIDKESPDSSSNTQRYQKPDDNCKILAEKDTSVCDTVSSKQTPAKPQAGNGVNIPPIIQEKPQGSFRTAIHPPPGFANPLKKVIYGLQGANPPPGFNKS